MASIIGAGKIKYHRKPKPKPKPELAAYRERNESLRAVGWRVYADYLASPEWKAIRGRTLKSHPKCVACGGDAAEVHHISYADEVLFGAVPALLVSVCRRCHELIEFESGEKVSLEAANRRLVAAANHPDQMARFIDNGFRKLAAFREESERRRKKRDKGKPKARMTGRRQAGPASKGVPGPPAHLIPFLRPADQCNNRKLNKAKGK